MFRRKPTKIGYKILPIKQNGKMVGEGFVQIARRCDIEFGETELAIVDGPSLRCGATFDSDWGEVIECIKDRSYVAVWVPEGYCITV